MQTCPSSKEYPIIRLNEDWMRGCYPPYIPTSFNTKKKYLNKKIYTKNVPAASLSFLFIFFNSITVIFLCCIVTQGVVGPKSYANFFCIIFN